MTAQGGLATPQEEPGPDAPLPGARAALMLLLAINLFNYIDRQVLAAVVTPIRKEFFPGNGTATEETAGTVVMALLNWMEKTLGFQPEKALVGSLALAFMVAYMVLSPIFGWLAERGRRWLLVGIGVILWSLASGGTGLAATFGILFLTRCLVGVGEAAYGPVAPAMISDLYPVARRGQVMAWFYVAIPVGGALGYVLGGAVAQITGDWRWAFYVVIPPGLFLGLWCFFMREPPRGRADFVGPRREEPPPEPTVGIPLRRPSARDYLVLLKTPSYVICTLGMTAMTFAIGGIAFWMPDYIFDYRGEPDLARVNLTFGAIVVVSGLCGTLLGGLAGDWLRPRYPGSYFLVSGTAMLLGFPLTVAMLYVPFPWAWVFIFLAVFCLFFNTGPTNTILANVMHPSIRASGFALNILIIHAFGDAVSPLIIGAVADRSSLHDGFLLVSGMILVSGLLWFWGARHLQRDTALAISRLS
jgi:MFS family permease